jgi:hypothetical protein
MSRFPSVQAKCPVYPATKGVWRSPWPRTLPTHGADCGPQCFVHHLGIPLVRNTTHVTDLED